MIRLSLLLAVLLLTLAAPSAAQRMQAKCSACRAVAVSYLELQLPPLQPSFRASLELCGAMKVGRWACHARVQRWRLLLTPTRSGSWRTGWSRSGHATTWTCVTG